jgi:3-keto-5-aminohexanoate cleavage enzyme
MALSDKVIVTVAPNGSLTTKQMNPHVPVTPEELWEEAVRCYNAGAAVIHIHGRDKDQKPSHDPEFFRRALGGIRERCPIVTQVSTGGRASSGETRIQSLRFGPEMASLNVGSTNVFDGVYINPPNEVEFFASAMKKAGVKPEMECFDLSHVWAGRRLVEQGFIEAPPYFTVILGMKGGLPFTPRNMLALRDAIPEGIPWNSLGVSRFQLPVAVMAIAMGGNVRVGLEDNIYYTRGVLATNAQLVERVVRIAREAGREPATPDEAREILGIKKPSA